MQTSQPTDVLFLTFDRQIDRRVLLMCSSLNAAGIHTNIYAMPGGSSDGDSSQVVRIDLQSAANGLEKVVASLHAPAMKLLANWPRLLHRLKSYAWTRLVTPDAYYVQLFWPHIQHTKPMVVVAVDLPMLPVASRLADLTGAKLVYDSHELFAEQNFSPKEKAHWTQVEEKLIARCDQVITVNLSIANELAKRYLIPTPAVILNAERGSNSPAQNNYFHRLWSLPASQRILLYQGGMSTDRGIENLVLAMKKLHDQNLTLVLLGDGEITSTLKRLILRSGMSDRVRQHPAVPQDQLLAITAASDLGVIPYRGDCLNNFLCTPNKLFEYIAAGIPILANDLPELRRFVVGRCLGVVGAMETPEQIAQLIDGIFSSETLLSEYRINVETARREINWEIEGRKLVTLLEALR